MTVHIHAIGVAAPSLRLDVAEVNTAWGRGGGRGQVGVCASDEDVLSLAWAAADRALQAASADPASIDGLWWGSSRLPFAEGPSWALLAAALRLGGTTDGACTSGSSHAGMEALRAAVDAVAAGRVHRALAVTADAVVPARGSGQEAAAGAGAAAVVVSADPGPARLGAAVTRWLPVLDRYRGDREEGTREAYDGRLFREEIFLPLAGEAAGALETGADTRWSLPDPDGRLGRALARRIDAAELVSAGTRAELGDTAAAAPLLGLAGAMATPGRGALVAYGGGRATALAVDVDAPVPGAADAAGVLATGRPTSYTGALRARGLLRPDGESVEMAVPPGSAMFVRGNAEVLGLLGARCVECGTICTPPSIHPACLQCGSDKFDHVPLGRDGTVVTFVVNHTMPPPFEAPLPLVCVDLDEGGRIMLQGVGDGTDLAVGARVGLVLRRYAVERGVPVHGWKVQAS